MTLELLLIRHGATTGNAERRYIGQATDLSLSEHGRKELTDRRARGVYPPADALYSSPMSRCVETARLLYPMLVPTILPSLAELDFGAFEGKTYEQLKDDPAYRRWIDTQGLTAPPGGESGQEFTGRLRGAMRQIADDAGKRKISRAAVVTHGGCIMNLIVAFHSASHQGNTPVDMYDYQAVNGGGYRITVDTKTLSFLRISSL